MKQSSNCEHHHEHHHHEHHHHHHHHHSETGNIAVAFFLNLAFTIIELIGGILTNSVAILSDALHDFGDCISLGVAWHFQKLSNKERDHRFSYGYKRFSILGAIINCIILIVGAALILREAVPRLFHPEVAHAEGMIGLAILGIIVNGAAVLRLRQGTSINEKVVSLHLLEDVLGWVAVLIGAIVMYFYQWPIIDPILSIGIAFFIIFNAYRSLRYTLEIVMQAIPKDIDLSVLKQEIKQLPAIKDLHDIHIWTLDGQSHVMSIHAVLQQNYTLTDIAPIKQTIREKLADLNVQHVTIEFEAVTEDCVIATF